MITDVSAIITEGLSTLAVILARKVIEDRPGISPNQAQQILEIESESIKASLRLREAENQ